MNRVSVIRKTDPPDSNSHISNSGPGTGVSASAPTSENLLSPIPEDTQKSMAVTGPSPNTSVVARPGSSKTRSSTNTVQTLTDMILVNYF